MLGKICGHTETSSDTWTCSHTVLQYTFVIFLSFLTIKKCTKSMQKICRKLAELTGCLRVFSAVPVVPVPGNSAL